MGSGVNLGVHRGQNPTLSRTDSAQVSSRPQLGSEVGSPDDLLEVYRGRQRTRRRQPRSDPISSRPAAGLELCREGRAEIATDRSCRCVQKSSGSCREEESVNPAPVACSILVAGATSLFHEHRFKGDSRNCGQHLIIELEALVVPAVQSKAAVLVAHAAHRPLVLS